MVPPSDHASVFGLPSWADSRMLRPLHCGQILFRPTGGERSRGKARRVKHKVTNGSTMPKSGQHNRRDSSQRQLLRRVVVVVALLTCIAFWMLPSHKPNAVLGRLSYPQFYAALTLSMTAVLGLVVWSQPRRRRRQVGFRVCAVTLCFGIVILGLELVAWVLPVRSALDNPWYLVPTLGGVAKSDDLPYTRPAHIHWTGSSRGDMALLNNDEDPEARTITFQTDKDGFRNSKELDQAEIVTIGDSFTEAGNMPEEETFSFLLGQEMNRTVRNLGRSGYSTPTEFIVFKKYGLPGQPKFVVWQIAEANDLDDVRTYEFWLAHGRPDYFDFAANTKPTRVQAWQGRSLTYRFFSGLRHRDPHPWPLAGYFKTTAGEEKMVRFWETPGMQLPARGNSAWSGFSRPIEEAASLCHSNNIRLLIVLIPDKLRVIGPATRFEPEVALVGSRFPGLPPETALGTCLRDFCETRRIPFLDTTEALRNAAAAGNLVYQGFDTHLSAAGHQIVADAIAKVLQKQE